MVDRTRRLFIALWPSDAVRDAIARAVRQGVQGTGGRANPPSNYHVTLAFLGSIADSRGAEALRCVEETSVKPFELHIGVFEYWRRQALVCLEPTAGLQELAELVGRLRATLAAHRFVIEERPFKAHLTLVRDVRSPPSFGENPSIGWPVTKIELVESTLSVNGGDGEGGSVYTLIGSEKSFH